MVMAEQVYRIISLINDDDDDNADDGDDDDDAFQLDMDWRCQQ